MQIIKNSSTTPKIKQIIKEAFDNGYRIIDNMCISPKGKISKGYNDKGYLKTGRISHHLLLAYEKYGETWFNNNFKVMHIDGNTLRNTIDNIWIDLSPITFDSSLYDGVSLEKLIVLYAFHKGFRIDDNVIYYNGSIYEGGTICSKGYKFISLTIPNVKSPKKCYVHKLAAYQKFGDEWVYSKLIIRHLNNIKVDNNFDNIALGTPKDNYDDMFEEDLIRLRARRSATKTRIKDISQINSIIEYKRNNKTYNEIATIFGVSPTSIYRILRKYNPSYFNKRKECKSFLNNNPQQFK